MLVLPAYANAGLLSDIMGTQASADTNLPSTNNEEVKNSQNMALLDPSLSTLPPLPEKKTDKKNEKDDVIDTESSVQIVADNALMPNTTPIGDDQEASALDFSEDDVSIYVVRKGDTFAQIAEMFDVSVDTILSANDLKKGAKPVVGDVLFILPFSGIEHTVKKGQTIQSIAKIYKIDADEIMLYNHLETGNKLTVGEKLIIPGAEMLKEETISKPKIAGSSGGILSAKGGTSVGVDTTGYFINPVPSGHRVRGLSRTHKGVDIGAPTGTPIKAAASGRVIFAKTGWNGKYGNLVIIEHPNGTKTLYAHMSRLGTTVGAQVSKGEVIGYVGSTGRSTGPHLHFEVLGGKNPF